MVLLLLISKLDRALAHSATELDEWTESWTKQADISLSSKLTAEWDDMIARHPWYFNPTPANQVTTSQVRTGWSGSVEQWRGLVAEYFPANQVDRALCIMNLESKGDPNADNPRSTAAGLFQFLKGTWDNTVPATITGGSYDSGRVYLPRANVAAAGLLWLNIGWTQWSPYNRGFCH